ncbi:TRAP transporter small permease [Bosea sp. BH3]|uniref:TRAP transporter small permease n=1 Tax=Bosea sp. BH3 TaxID=2871701 RepID=UPI0021CAF328|nr:TRAP transporter small permease [Bosea sp. BH3]MCU4182545.1 TRAP transporter small permease [Bosea sp. BH3]
MHTPNIVVDAPILVGAVDSRTYAIDRAVEPLRWVFRWGSLVMLVAMVSLPFIQVVSREILNLPIIGVEELARFMLICSTFLALPYVISAGANIRMDEFVGLMPAGMTRLAKLSAAAVSTATFGAMAVASLIAIGTNLDNATPTLGIPYWIFLGAAALGFMMSTLECGILLVKVIQDRPLYVTFPQEHEPEEALDLPEDMRH